MGLWETWGMVALRNVVRGVGWYFSFAERWRSGAGESC